MAFSCQNAINSVSIWQSYDGLTVYTRNKGKMLKGRPDRNDTRCSAASRRRRSPQFLQSPVPTHEHRTWTPLERPTPAANVNTTTIMRGVRLPPMPVVTTAISQI